MDKPDTALIVSIASIPQRIHLVDKTVKSFVRQTLPPARILVVVPLSFRRWPGLTANITRIQHHALLEVHTCDQDDGPGTKLLCALPRAAELWRGELAAKGTLAALVLADDDREYKPTALSLMAAAFRDSAGSERAFTFLRYELPGSGGLQIGQGADLFAVPLAPLLRLDVKLFFEVACSVDERFRYHDDVWISALLQDVAGVRVCPVTLVDKDHALAPPQFLGAVHGAKET